MTDRSDDGNRTSEPHDEQPAPGGDDERENRESIAESGEPATDALGNADGAS